MYTPKRIQQRSKEVGQPSRCMDDLPVQVIRSAKRVRSVSARIVDGSVVVRIPGHFSRSQERHWVQLMLAKLRKNPGSAEPEPPALALPEWFTQAGLRAQHNAQLLNRCQHLVESYLADQISPQQRDNLRVRWVGNQRTRWGSATPTTLSIRISARIAPFPEWVQDYVLIHELAHLVQPNHSAEFWALVHRYERTDAAKTYLRSAHRGRRQG